VELYITPFIYTIDQEEWSRLISLMIECVFGLVIHLAGKNLPKEDFIQISGCWHLMMWSIRLCKIMKRKGEWRSRRWNITGRKGTYRILAGRFFV